MNDKDSNADQNAQPIPDICGTRDTFLDASIDSELMKRIQEAIAFNMLWMQGDCPLKDTHHSAIGGLAKFFHALTAVSGADPVEEAKLWRKVIELAMVRFGTLVAEAQLRLVLVEAHGQPYGGKPWGRRRWVFQRDKPDDQWFEGKPGNTKKE